MAMLVRDWMNPRPLTVGSRSTVAEAKALMQRYWIRHLLVVDDPVLVGIITDRDIRTVSLPPGGQFSLPDREAHLRREVVGGVMTRDPRTVRSDAPLREAARLMLEHKFGGLPVVDDGHLMGIITETDILRAFLQLTEGEQPA